jgi:hypothetical protein
MKERKAFLLRIDPALYEALEEWAQQELRSVNGQIEYVLKDAVARRRGRRPAEDQSEPPPAADRRPP